MFVHHACLTTLVGAIHTRKDRHTSLVSLEKRVLRHAGLTEKAGDLISTASHWWKLCSLLVATIITWLQFAFSTSLGWAVYSSSIHQSSEYMWLVFEHTMSHPFTFLPWRFLPPVQAGGVPGPCFEPAPPCPAVFDIVFTTFSKKLSLAVWYTNS